MQILSIEKLCVSILNLLQGSAAGNVVVLDAINLSKTIRKAKTNKLQIPEEDFQLDDKVKLRKDTYAFLNDIVSRIENVANAEIDIAKKAIQIVYDCFDDDEVEEEDIDALLIKVNQFYKEIDETQINIKAVAIDGVKKAIKQIAKAIGDITRVLDEDDPLTILMAFSGDPVGVIQPLIELIKQVEKDISEANKQISSRKSLLGNSETDEESGTHYKIELSVIASDMDMIGVLR